MCYDAVSATRQLLKYALHRGDVHLAEELTRKLEDLTVNALKPYHYVSGFSHPGLLVFTNEQPVEPQVFIWGLIPSWVKDHKTAMAMMNQTLNARAETIFSKPAFRYSAKNRRCIVYVDAFYEHHHAFNQTYPHYITSKDGTPLAMAGLWDEWKDPLTGEFFKTVSIVTTTANALMKKIHNNPKLDESRMPVILQKADQEAWLGPCATEDDEKKLKRLLVPVDDDFLKAHTTRKLKGKTAVGNVPDAENYYPYPELEQVESGILPFNNN